MDPTLEEIETRLEKIPDLRRSATSMEERQTYDREAAWLLEKRDDVAPPTDDVIEYCIHMVATNWRRKAAFNETQFPTYYEAFKMLSNNELRKAINQFIIDYTESFPPPFGVIKQYVFETINVKKQKQANSSNDCPDCHNGQRYTSVLWQSQGGEYKMQQAYVACMCPAGSQRVKNVGVNHEGNTLTNHDEWLEKVKRSERVINYWVTDRTQRELPYEAFRAGNHFMSKQLMRTSHRKDMSSVNRSVREFKQTILNRQNEV